MTDNRQVASVLALIGGIIAIAFGALMGLMFAWMGGVFGSMVGSRSGFGGPEGAFLALFGTFGVAILVLGVGSGIVMILASRHLKSEDPQVRRQWALWSIVAGAICFVTAGGLISGGLGIGAGIVTYVDLNKQGL